VGANKSDGGTPVKKSSINSANLSICVCVGDPFQNLGGAYYHGPDNFLSKAYPFWFFVRANPYDRELS
jgi:hypothetical protein